MLQAALPQSLHPFKTPAILLNRGSEAGRKAEISLVGVVTSFGRNGEVYGEGETFTHVYKVISGVVRTSKLLPDGRRQISGFHLPGDMFGLEPGGTRHFSAEAVVATKVVAFRWQGMMAAGERSTKFANELLQVTMKELRQAQEQLLLVGRKNALERVAAFLLEMSDRSGSSNVVDLSMPRHDIADYLGLTLETVSRMFAELKELGVISLEGARRIRLLDRGRLTDSAA